MFFQDLTPKPTKTAFDLILQDAKDRFEQANKIMSDEHASEAEKVQAAYVLAIHHKAGWGGATIDENLSMSYYKKAAEKGHAGACYELARNYFFGNVLIGIKRDLNMAEYYINCGFKDNTIAYDTSFYKQAHQQKLLEGFLEVIKAVRESMVSQSAAQEKNMPK
jgi:TPR repeat protein